MRLLTSLIAVSAMALTASAWAQEEETTSTPVEEQPATTIEETPAPAPAIETTPTPPTRLAPPAAMSATPKPEKSAAAAGSPAAKAASPAPTPAMAGKKMSVEATVKDNENRWAAAGMKHDVATVEAMVADDFVGVSSKGKFTNRRALLNEMKGDKDNYTSAKNEKLDVHRFGNDVAVVVGRYREKGTGKDGNFDRTYYFTDTWMQRKGAWKCVASQSMLLGGKK